MTDATTTAASSEITLDSGAPYGYRRAEQLQTRFEQAAQQLLRSDGWAQNGEKNLVADLALEGGGVKGIGIVGAVSVLAEAGYRFPRVAGSSAGAIAAALIASITRSGAPMTSLNGFLDGLTFTSFMPQGVVHRFMDHHLGRPGEVLSDAEILTHRMGVYSGDYLAEWLRPILNEQLGVRTFSDLKISQEDDPGMSLPVNRRYGLVVHTSDVTRRQLVHLPWDYNFYGKDPDQQDVVEAVRASMSIPFFFEPVTFEALPADADVPRPGGGSIRTHYDGGTVTWVDGGMLRNFPIHAFDRADGKAPRWPTIGVKLSSLVTDMATTLAARSAYGVGRGCLATLTSEWDSYDVDASTAGRTIFVDHGPVGTTDFDLTQAQRDMLFLNGVAAATDFVIEMGARGGVPRTDSESTELVRERQPPA